VNTSFTVFAKKRQEMQMTKLYSSPKVTRSQARLFSELIWESSGEDESFRNLSPFYLVYRKQDLTAIGVRLRFEGDKEYGHWQAVGAVPPLDSDAPCNEESLDWILLGYVPTAVRFDAKVRFRDAKGRHPIAIAHDLIVEEHETFELAFFEVP
jgi:hypothetical protein